MIVPTGYDEQAFSRDVLARWGHLSDGLAVDRGLLHHQMAHLARLCAAQPAVAPEVFEFLDGLLDRRDAISEIENAVAISFLDWTAIEKLGFSRADLPCKLAGCLWKQWKLDGGAPG